MSTTHLTHPGPSARSAPTSPQRDSFIDVLRAGAILVVVSLHWLMPVLSYDDGRLTTGNALTIPGAWIATWLVQVMPLVFFAGGASAAMDISRRRTTMPDGLWVARRLVRIAWPVVPLALVWVPLPYVLEAAGVPGQPLDLASRTVGQLLWFLAVYVVVIALTPLLVRAHRICRGWEIAVLAAAAAVIDVARFGPLDGDSRLAYVNIILVWTAIYQIGVAYGTGRLSRMSIGRSLAAAGAGFACTAIAVAAGPYPSSMIGMPGAPASNMNPPTAVLISLAVGQLGLAFAAKPAIEAWARRPEPAKLVETLSSRLMTIYLWHMPVLVVIAGIAVIGFGFSTPSVLSDEWRSLMPLWVASGALVLTVIVALLGRFERPPARLIPARLDSARLEAGAALIGVALLLLTVFGFRHTWIIPGPLVMPPFPVIAATALGVGLTLLRGSRLPGSFHSVNMRKA